MSRQGTEKKLPLHVLATVGSTSFTSLLTHLLEAPFLETLTALSSERGSGTPTLTIQHGSTPLRDLLEPFLAAPVDPSSRLPAEPGLRKVGNQWGYGGATARLLDPGEVGTLSATLASSSSRKTAGGSAKPASSGLADVLEDGQTGEMTSQISQLRSEVRQRRMARQIDADADTLGASRIATSLIKGKAASRTAGASSSDSESDDSSDSESDDGISSWNLAERPSESDTKASGETDSDQRIKKLELMSPQGVRVVLVDYLPALGPAIAEADVVISHAGAGTILETLRAPTRPKLLVVPNRSLMDDHQAELATALEEQGYLASCRIEQVNETLGELLHEDAEDQRVFPEFQPERFRSLVDETMGYSATE